jgi:ComF family protein
MVTDVFSRFFPRRCLGCNAETTSYICSDCIPNSRKVTILSSELSYTHHYEGILKKIIHLYKLNKYRSLKKYFIPMIDHSFFEGFDWVIPVPTHWTRRWMRGFDHLYDIYHQIDRFNSSLVRRKKRTPFLHTLNRDDRRQVLSGVFIVKDASLIKGRSICVVDDILTTGATFGEIKKVLIQAGAKNVVGYFLCKVEQ